MDRSAPRSTNLPFRLLNDEPVYDARHSAGDLLGTRRRAGELASLILRSAWTTPFTIAVDADWGMGKSSLMHRVKADLESQPGVECVWFNAWTSHGDDALEALIKSVLERFDRSALRRAARRVGRQGRVLAAVRGALRAVLELVQMGSAADDLWTAFAGDAKSRNDLRQVIKSLAADWVATPVPETGRRPMLVVFVDDLDRCGDETVQAVCEAVKVYLDVPGLVFVLGCDQARLASAGQAGGGSYGAVDYLEKIIQSSYRIPVPTGEEARVLIQAYTTESATDAVIRGPLLDVLAERTGRNPRRIKRLINSFVLEYQLAPQWWGFGPEALIHVVLLQHLYPDFYRAAARPGGRDMVSDFLAYRQARSVLRGVADIGAVSSVAEGDAPSPHNPVTELFSSLELAVPAISPGADLTDHLSELEEALPPAFTQLVTDDDFVTVLTDIESMEQANQLWQHVRSTGAAPAAGPPISPPPSALDSVQWGSEIWRAERACPNGHPVTVEDEWCPVCAYRVEQAPVPLPNPYIPAGTTTPQVGSGSPWDPYGQGETGTYPVPQQQPQPASAYTYPEPASSAPADEESDTRKKKKPRRSPSPPSPPQQQDPYGYPEKPSS
ncbi:KAP family P-loop NTPase fold protein [Streptomyces boninensis]|uniref:KAP family P-loop NTPase fold protein n=1 Tax=Streptomyces boninensis TaxID=2039455 RepID=UPI003B2153C7